MQTCPAQSMFPPATHAARVEQTDQSCGYWCFSQQIWPDGQSVVFPQSWPHSEAMPPHFAGSPHPVWKMGKPSDVEVPVLRKQQTFELLSAHETVGDEVSLQVIVGAAQVPAPSQKSAMSLNPGSV